MARIIAVLGAVRRAVWRDLRTLESIAGNNFFLFVLLVMYQQPSSVYFFGLILGVLVLFPMSADPLSKVPRDRMELWPLTRRDRALLRVATIALSPVTWIVVLLLLKTAQWKLAIGLVLVAMAFQVVLTLANRFAGTGWNLFLHVPAPRNGFGELFRKDLRQILSMLDIYVALLLALAAVVYRITAPNPNISAFPVLAIIVVLAMSTYGQCLFGLDGEGGITRYELLPVRGWQILAVKNAAYLLPAVLLVLPIAPVPGWTAALVSLAVGNYASVQKIVIQQRWRFTAGTVVPMGVIQVIAMIAFATASHQVSVWFLAGAAAAWLISLWWCGLMWDHSR